MNLIRPEAMPYTNAVGMTYDSGQYEANMDLAMRIADWDGFEARRRNAADRGRLLGRGLANYVEFSIGSPKERTEITVFDDDRVDVVIGTQPSGQGHETSFAQVASDLLGVPVASIYIITGDTDIVTAGGGSHSGRSLRHAATVMSKAAEELIARAKRDRRPAPQRKPGPDRVCGRPVRRTQHQSVIQPPRAGQGAGTIDLARRAEATASA